MPRALIVDDVEENRYLLRLLLEGNGYQVRTAADGQAALDAAAGDRPDVVVSDILMPGMDGFTLCRRWRQDPRFAAIPFIFYTATYTDPRDEEFALRLGADLFLVKPVEPTDLLDRIRTVLARAAAGEPRPGDAGEHDEPGYFKEYSQTLIRKLEDKLTQLLEANRALLVKDAALQSATSAIGLLDLQGRITYANPAFARLFDRPADVLVGALLGDVAGHPAADVIERGMQATGEWFGEIETTVPPSRRLVLDGAVHTVTEPNGQALCRMVSFQDVTERRRMAEEMERNQRLASLCLFAGGIAHDFNNLLTGIFGNLELALGTLPPASPARAYLDTAIRAYERARDLTGRLLSFARSRPPSRRRQQLVPLLRECSSLCLSGSTIRCSIAGSETDCVLGDPNQLAQVFTNILINARQAMPAAGGTVHITIDPVGATDAPALPEGRYVRVDVRDEGTGIPASVVPRVFDPFFTTKVGGTGLGLAVCHSIVESHGGAIRLASSPGEGTTVSVVLPACDPQAAEEPAGEAGRRPAGDDGGNARVLVMDDEEHIREMASRMLSQAGHVTETAADGERALEACRVAALERRPFDVVLLDVTVRGGMGGLETLAQIRKQFPATGVVLSSGYAEKGWAHEEVHPDAVLPKPYQMQELLDAVRDAARRAGQRQGPGR